MPAHAVADDRQRQVEVRRRLDQPDAAAQVEIDDRRFEVRLVRAVDQVEAERQRRPSARCEPVDRRARRRRATARPRRRTRASRPGPSPRRSRPSRCRWPSPRTCRRSGRRGAPETRVAQVLEAGRPARTRAAGRRRRDLHPRRPGDDLVTFPRDRRPGTASPTSSRARSRFPGTPGRTARCCSTWLSRQLPRR